MLLALFHQGEAYGRAVARDFGISLDAVQRQLDRFERSGVLVCKRQGRTLIYLWNPKSRLATRLRDLTGVVYDGLDPQVKEQLFAERRQPRAKDKPVIRSGWNVSRLSQSGVPSGGESSNTGFSGPTSSRDSFSSGFVIST